uniref:Alliinase C-terminal domain-containing protein n=1 Tax=Oryza meridionalis TaxID=40149 RepID=A0A0E0BXQ4_9ORYZ
MAALRVGTRAVEGRFQASNGGGGGGGGMAPSSRLVAAHREAKPRSSHSAAPWKLPRRRGGAMPLWRVAVFASVALNVATLALLLHHYATSPPHHYHDAGLTTRSSDAAAHRRARTASSMAPSTGKPAVTTDSVINLDHGDPTMFEEFWRETGDAAEVVIPGWQTMSYFSDVTNVCWFLEPELDRQSYPAVTDFLRSGLFRWAGDADAFGGDSYIELVCSPNNPDGAIREAVLDSKTGNGRTVHDLAYYWPQYTPITKRAAHDIMLFTVSKSTGHAGTRIGWALVKDRAIARKMTKFVELNTIGVSKDSQMRAAKVLAAVSDGYERRPEQTKETKTATPPRLFDFGRRKMVERWSMLRAAVAASGIFSLPEETSGFCNFTKDVEDCAGFLRGHKILTRSGAQFGADARYVRVSMLDRDDAYDIFINRLSSLK